MSILLILIDPANLLLSIFQDHRPRKYYIEEFLDLSNQVLWNDATLKTISWSSLDDPLFRKLPAAATTCAFKRFIDNIVFVWIVLYR